VTAENLINEINESDNETRINKKIILQIIVKTINNTADLDELMLILLIIETYSRMHFMNSSTSSISQRAMTIEKAMIEIENSELNVKSQMF
jgi:hypothetical protein